MSPTLQRVHQDPDQAGDGATFTKIPAQVPGDDAPTGSEEGLNVLYECSLHKYTYTTTTTKISLGLKYSLFSSHFGFFCHMLLWSWIANIFKQSLEKIVIFSFLLHWWRSNVFS